MEITGISKSTLQRLPDYLTYLKTHPEKSSLYISATAIATALNLGEVQVRKDLASISDAGKPKIGYAVSELIFILENFLGYNNSNDAIVFGAGKLGRALLDYNGFKDYGLNIIAGFDIDKSQEGVTTTGKPVMHITSFADLCSSMKIKIGIIAVPAEEAQKACELMIANGILAIMNFAPTHLLVPDNIIVQNENIAASLAVLSNRLREKITKIKP